MPIRFLKGDEKTLKRTSMQQINTRVVCIPLPIMKLTTASQTTKESSKNMTPKLKRGKI